MFSITSFCQIPDKIKLEEEVISIGTCFEVTGMNNTVIDEKIVSMTASFTMKTGNAVVARAKQHMISWGSKIDIYDGKGGLIGTIEEEVFESMFSSVYTKYSIYDSKHQLVATSKKHDLMSTKFTIENTKGHVICTITRPAINMMSDTWNITFSNCNVNKALFIFIPCYKTYRDNK